MMQDRPKHALAIMVCIVAAICVWVGTTGTLFDTVIPASEFHDIVFVMADR